MEDARDEHEPAGTDEPEAVLDVLDDVLGVGVDEHDVVGVLVHAGEDFACPAGDEARLGGGDLRVGEGAARSGKMLRLFVDRGEHRAGRTAQQPEARDAGTCADLDDALRLGGGGEDGQLGAERGADRCRPQLDRVGAGTGDRLRLGRGLADVPLTGVVCAHGSSCCARSSVRPRP